MVSAGQTEINHEGEKTYSLFEPCHGGDEYEGSLKNQGCGAKLWRISRCDFSGIRKLWGWADPHSTKNHGATLTSRSAGLACNAADLVAMKTVDYGHRLEKWKWLIEQTPDMHVLAVVRDPRGIYASWKTLEPFASLVKKGQFYTLLDICESFASNLNFTHPRVHNVVFENLVKQPQDEMLKAYNLLGLPFKNREKAWLNSTFDAKACPEPKPWEIGFTDCHTNSKVVAEKWRSVLTKAELETFNNSAACRQVIEHYGYPP
jgi:hypothetical protein